MPLATPPLYAARPQLDVAGTRSPELADGLLSLVVTETTEGLSRCEAVFGNWGRHNGGNGYLYSDRQLLDFGTTLAVEVGAGDRAGTVFAGTITGLEAHFPEHRPPEIAVLAEDRFQDFRMTRRTRSFEDVSDADVIGQIVGEHGLTPDVDVDGPTHRIIAQLNLSDLAFVRERARIVDAELWIEDDTVHAAARGRRAGGDVPLRLNADLREVSVLADVAQQRTSVTVAGWDVGAKQAISTEADGAAIRAELDGGTSGVDILEAAFGPRPETIVHTVALSSAEARARAEAAMRTSARRFLTAVGVAEGDARIRVGARLDLSGLGPGFSGRYHVVEAEHLFNGQSGYTTRFRGERPSMGAAS